MRLLIATTFASNPFYQRRWAAAEAGREVDGLDDFRARFPFTWKHELVADQAEHPAAKEGEVVLVVEDDPMVLRLAVQLLTRLGYLGARASDTDYEAIARRAVEEARAVGDPDSLQEALYTLHFLIGSPDRLEDDVPEASPGAASNPPRST